MRSVDIGSLRVYQKANFTACPSSGGPELRALENVAWRGSGAAAATAATDAAAPVIKTFKAQPAPSVLPGCDMGVTRL